MPDKKRKFGVQEKTFEVTDKTDTAMHTTGEVARRIARGADIELVMAQILLALQEVNKLFHHKLYKIPTIKVFEAFFETVLRQANLDHFAQSLIEIFKGTTSVDPRSEILQLDMLDDADLLKEAKEVNTLPYIYAYLYFDVGETESLSWQRFRSAVETMQSDYTARSIKIPRSLLTSPSESGRFSPFSSLPSRETHTGPTSSVTGSKTPGTIYDSTFV
jgi:hypothetical protein